VILSYSVTTVLDSHTREQKYRKICRKQMPYKIIFNNIKKENALLDYYLLSYKIMLSAIINHTVSNDYNRLISLYQSRWVNIKTNIIILYLI